MSMSGASGGVVWPYGRRGWRLLRAQKVCAGAGCRMYVKGTFQEGPNAGGEGLGYLHGHTGGLGCSVAYYIACATMLYSLHQMLQCSI